MSDFNAGIIDEFRTNGGKVGGMFEGTPLLLLHHKGAKTGAQRVSPLVFQSLGDSYAIFASKAGAPSNPDWFHNVMANPETTIEVAADRPDVVARVATEEERGPIWEQQKTTFPQFAEYERKATRQIPVVILEPV